MDIYNFQFAERTMGALIPLSVYGAIRDFVRRQSLPRAKGASCAFTPTRNRETDLWHRSVSLFYDHPANFRRPLPISLVP